jgi:dynein light intermediate chain 1
MFRPEDLEKMCVVIVLDFDQPWDLMNSMQRWIEVIQDTVLNLMPKLDFKVQEKLRKKLANHVQTYEEPFSEDSLKIAAKSQGKMESAQNSDGTNAETIDNDDEEDLTDLKMQMPLPEGVLTVNLGIPIIVACTKSDLIKRGEKAQMLEQNIDFI